MAKMSSPQQAARKPALSRVSSTERKQLVLVGKSIIFGTKIDKAKKELSDLQNSSSRLKITKEVKLRKSITGWTKSKASADNKAKVLADRLAVYKAFFL